MPSEELMQPKLFTLVACAARAAPTCTSAESIVVVQDVKHIMECRQHKARCGAILRIDDPSTCPLSMDQRHQLAVRQHSTLAVGTDSCGVPAVVQIRLPRLAVAQPGKVLLHEVSTVRHERRTSGHSAAVAAIGTLTDLQLQRLHHAFVRLSGGDGLEHTLPQDKLQELLVMANMDATEASTAALVGKLVRTVALLHFSLADSACLVPSHCAAACNMQMPSCT